MLRLGWLIEDYILGCMNLLGVWLGFCMNSVSLRLTTLIAVLDRMTTKNPYMKYKMFLALKWARHYFDKARAQ